MEYVSLGDTVRFGVTIHCPSGLTNQLITPDETPRWYVYTSTSGDNPLLQGNFTARSNLIGTYQSNFACTGANNFVTGDYVEVHASGKVNSIVSRAIIKTFVIDDLYNVNIYSVSGVRVNSPLDVNIQRVANVTATNPLQVNTVQISGQYVKNPLEVNVIQVSGVPVAVADDMYFAGIKYIKDGLTIDDEYVVQWFKNASPLASGNVTNAAISVYKTSDSTSLFTNKVLTYFSVNHGGMRYNEPTFLTVSGEIYMAVTSGTIDGGTRVWNNPIGIDFL